MHVRGLESLGLQLTYSGVLVGDTFHLLLLNTRRGNIHAEDDVFRFTHGKTSDIDVVFLRVVCQDKIFELHFDVDPLLIGESWPDMMWLRYHTLVGRKDNLRPLRVQVECT